MDEQTVLDIGTKAVWVAIQVATPVLVAALATGLIVSIIQAATQINEQTLSFIPKIFVMTAALVLCGPWILQVMMNFTLRVFNLIPNVIH